VKDKIATAVIPTLLGILLTVQGWIVIEVMKSKYTHLDSTDERRIVAELKMDTRERLVTIADELAKISTRLDMLADTQIQILIAIEAERKEH
jgi:hypothetical protein